MAKRSFWCLVLFATAITSTEASPKLNRDVAAEFCNRMLVTLHQDGGTRDLIWQDASHSEERKIKAREVLRSYLEELSEANEIRLGSLSGNVDFENWIFGDTYQDLSLRERQLAVGWLTQLSNDSRSLENNLQFGVLFGKYSISLFREGLRALNFQNRSPQFYGIGSEEVMPLVDHRAKTFLNVVDEFLSKPMSFGLVALALPNRLGSERFMMSLFYDKDAKPVLLFATHHASSAPQLISSHGSVSVGH
ncbi:MAG: hypothetical protein JWQ35_1988 [Bacteriovoracaceae bacterium]|nr:hypothetical protein [Bacteriovoracaceae bacterium]